MNTMSLSEMITYSTVLIRCQYVDGTSGSGTGFIINLCTNKETGQCVPVHGGPMFNAKGVLQFANLPNVPVPITCIPANLGTMIKAERILEFETMIKDMMMRNSDGQAENGNL